MTSSAPETLPEDALATAARWFARRRSGELTATETQELDAWLAASPDHREAFRDLQIAWRDVETMRDDPRIMAMRAEAAAAPNPLRRRILTGAIAAAFAVAAVGLATLGGREVLWSSHRYSDQEYRTGVGQRATVTLPDGTMLTLNTDSRVRTRASGDRRLVYLDRGQAFFKVAKDRDHPFVVTAAGRTITALGTAFDVRVDDGRLFKVTLVEGRVRVEAPPARAPAAPSAPTPQGQATEMVAGTQLVEREDAKWDLARTDVRRETSWTTGQLVFYSAPLTQVVAELNRYSDKKIVIDDESYAARPISGTFKAGDVDTFARGLETYRLARIESETHDAVVLGPPD
jgi:transmembrane sensor